MSEVTAIGLGEILWDVLPEGRQLGGAPANFAYQVNALGGTGVPVSRVGDDDLGREALDILQANGLCTDYVSIDPEHPTGTVLAELDKDGVATYTFPDDVAWDFLTCDDATRQLAERADVICFGTLAQRCPTSRQAIRQVLEAAPGALKVYDINLRQDFFTPGRIRDSLDRADVLKINDDELMMITGPFSLPSGQKEALARLLALHDLKLAVLTRGGEGSLIISPDGISDLPGEPVEVRDTIGAGDAFSAAMVLAYLKGWSLDEINRYAAQVAAHVCSREGAMTDMPPELRLK
ncbi:carbohydrate kinase [Pseudodesulfovibrio cashew]|uniref:Carbohydrate kinase n=1 Tax=Pseudodesulfovibrio cashew TaxID=2678688 RepID=A0A6I6JGU0_9BACT|nr:carbohydrate kinase [Pseudodesulfovibrio cashew]QGY39723.1 carbohydrate kinase [Pseudodesulfovibrio cashew]